MVIVDLFSVYKLLCEDLHLNLILALLSQLLVFKY